MSKKDGEVIKTDVWDSSQWNEDPEKWTWWQKELVRMKRQNDQLRMSATESDPARTWYSKMEYYKRLAEENRQRRDALEGKIARMDQAASHLLQTHEEMLAIIENFSKYAESYHRRNYGPQMTALSASARTAEQRFRRER